MSNHYHLLLETPEPNLVSGMKWLQGTYPQRDNARHRKRGHLFQGRYRGRSVTGLGPAPARPAAGVGRPPPGVFAATAGEASLEALAQA